MHQHRDVHEIVESIPPTTLVIFGATGNLSFNYLLPTLVHMDKKGLLPSSFRLICVGRKDFTVETFLQTFLKNNPEAKIEASDFINFSKHVIYYRGDFQNPDSFKGLTQVLADTKLAAGHVCYNRLYYFATAPEYFEPIAKILKQHSLLVGCAEHQRTIRVLAEKPFGEDLKSAKSLNKLLLKFFTEQQIYRIDHYLGKETVQNLLVMRFANDFLEPIWNAEYIDHVEISAMEDDGLEGRAGFYDKAGSLKDFVQNHLLNMLALIAIDKPVDLNPESIRNEKIKILNALKPFTKKDISKNIVRGQYAGYIKDLGKSSNTDTFTAMKVYVNLPRWKNVPFYLRTGKRLPRKVTEISVHFKKHTHGLFVGSQRHTNVLTFRIQPDENVSLQVNNKIPGFGISLHKGSLEFGYKTNFDVEIPSAYERLLLDFMEGDQRLFIRSDEIESAWKFIDSITKSWSLKSNPLESYAQGSHGPKSAAGLIEKDSREWWTK